MPQPYTNKPRSCDGCQAPISLPRHIRTLRCPRCRKIYAHSRDVTQRALRYKKLKAEGLWPTCLIERCDREAKNGARDALRGPCRALAQGPGHDGTG